MSEKYKGFHLPEIMFDEIENGYYIISDEGIFNGYSEKAVLDKWRLSVDHKHWISAINDGYHEVSDHVLGCPDCGLLVWDPHAHKNFHFDLTN